MSVGRLPARPRQTMGSKILLLSHSPSVQRVSVREASQTMRAADSDPAGGAIPVELVHRQPFDDFPKAGRGVEDK